MQNVNGPQFIEILKSKNQRCPREEASLPQGCDMETIPESPVPQPGLWIRHQLSRVHEANH